MGILYARKEGEGRRGPTRTAGVQASGTTTGRGRAGGLRARDGRHQRARSRTNIGLAVISRLCKRRWAPDAVPAPARCAAASTQPPHAANAPSSAGAGATLCLLWVVAAPSSACAAPAPPAAGRLVAVDPASSSPAVPRQAGGCLAGITALAGRRAAVRHSVRRCLAWTPGPPIALRTL